MALDVFGGAGQIGVGGLHVLLRDGGDGVKHALGGKDHVRPLVHVIALGGKRLADVLEHFRDFHQRHVAVEQIVDVVERVVVPQIVVNLLHVVRLAHHAVCVHGQNRQLQFVRFEHVGELPPHLGDVRTAHGQFDRGYIKAGVDHRRVAHFNHGRTQNHRVVIVIAGDAGVVIAFLIVKREDGRLPVVLERIDKKDGQRAQQQQRGAGGQGENGPAFGPKAHEWIPPAESLFQLVYRLWGGLSSGGKMSGKRLN